MNRLRRIGRQTERVEERQAAPTAEEAPVSPVATAPADVVETGSEAPTEAPAPEAVPESAPTPAVSDEAATGAAPGPVEASSIEPAALVETPAVPDEVAAPEAAEAEAPAQAAAPGVSEDSEEVKTAPLEVPVEREDLTPLPANAVIAGKYVVQSQLHHGSDRNLYRVVARKQQKCPACGRLSSMEATDCEHCGTSLESIPPADFYLMAESFYPQALMQDPTVMDLQLYHPNIVPVVDFFPYTPFGRTRYYAVAEPRQGVRLSQLSMPRPGPQVFGWAIQLADALDYLHSRGVVGAGAEADDILVQGDMASLASLQNARVAENESPERTQLQSIDLAKLAATIYEAYVGQPATMSPEGILPMPSQSPDKVVAAFRAAIEPVQGIAPPISAEQWRDMLSAALVAINEFEQPGRPVRYVSACLSDVGRVREQNQDSYSTTEFLQSSVERPMNVGLYVVADGMGGHKGGEIASSIASQVFSAEVMARVMAPLAASSGTQPALTNEMILQGMVRAVQSANERIYKARDSRQNDMGTTLVAALISGGKAYVVNVGDSRFYFYTLRKAEEDQDTGPVGGEDFTAPLKGATMPLKRTAALDEAAATDEPISRENYGLSQVSIDHSLVHRLVELGQLDPEEAKVHPHRNFIYRSLGGPPPVDVDTFVRTLTPGDRLLICSDGLNSMIEDSDIESVLATEEDPGQACVRLIDLANEAGGHDNITVLLIDITEYMPVHDHQ